jgi:hypothetical protein
MSAGNTQLRSLHELYGEKERPWSEKTEAIIRFWESESGECWGLPFFSLSAARFVQHSQPLLAAPYTLLPGGNDMGHGRPSGSRVLRGSRKAEGHFVESRW